MIHDFMAHDFATHRFAELVGIAAAAASLYAAQARTIIPLRIAAIIANALAMAYSSMHGTYPTLALNAILLPLNVWRLRAMLRLVRDIGPRHQERHERGLAAALYASRAFQGRGRHHGARRLRNRRFLYRLRRGGDGRDPCDL